MGLLYSIPEALAVPPAARRKLFAGWLRGGVITEAVQIGLLSFWIAMGVLAVAASVLTHLDPEVTRWLGLAGITAALVFVAAVVLAFLRGSWRTHLIQQVPTLDGNICAACGYDLRGSPGEECPECGNERFKRLD